MNTEEIIEGYLGNTQVNSIYQGSELVWHRYFGNRYLIGGVFTTPKNKIIRLNDNDSIDNTFNIGTGFNGSVYTLNIDTINQKIYVGGSFTKYNGTTQNRIVRLNMNGSLDTSFNIGTGFNGRVRSIIIDNTNSKIYVGGEFTTYKGSTQNRLVRLNLDGSLDGTFNIGTGFNTYGSSEESTGFLTGILIVLEKNKIYIAGDFSTYNNQPQKYIVRLNMDGSKDTSFNIGTGFNGVITSIKIDNINSRIYVGGEFTTYNDSTQNYLAILNMDGTKDTSFNIGTGFDGFITSIKIDNINSRIYVGGAFTTFKGGTQNRLVRLNMDGTKDTSFNIGTGLNKPSHITYVYDILIDNEKNKIYIVGNFTEYNNITRNRLARLNMNGSLDNTFNIQLNDNAHTILKYTEI